MIFPLLVSRLSDRWPTFLLSFLCGWPLGSCSWRSRSCIVGRDCLVSYDLTLPHAPTFSPVSCKAPDRLTATH